MTERAGPLPDGTPPSRFYARFTKTVRDQGASLGAPHTVPFELDLSTPASLAGVVADARLLLPPLPIGGQLAADEVHLVLELAAAIGQAKQIARAARTTVELYERLDVREITGRYDRTRSWDWRTQLRATEDP